MNSIFLILLLLCCCNHGDSGCGCGCEESRSCGEAEREERRPCGTPGQNARREENPFSPFNRDQCEDQDYPPFRGNKGPCGCEDTQDA